MNLKELIKGLNALTHSIAVLTIEINIKSEPTRLMAMKARLIKLDSLLDLMPTEVLSSFYRHQLGTKTAAEYYGMTKSIYAKLETLLGYTLRNMNKVCSALNTIIKLTTSKF